MPSDLLFVYGTLRRFHDNATQRLLQGHSVFLGEAYAKGQLYWIDGYPGMVPSPDPSDRVVGEVYRLTSPIILREIDRYEGYGPDFPEPNEFLRTEGVVTRKDTGEPLKCFLYVYNRSVDGRVRIESGDFFAAGAPTDKVDSL